MKDTLKLISKYLGFYNLVSRLQLFLKYCYYQLVNRYLNKYALEQESDLLSIPVIIISFNQYTYLKNLIDYLLNHEFKKIIIVDNNSSYKLLLKYLKEISNNKEIEVIRLNKNYGHRVFWLAPNLYERYAKGYYILTDPDILPMSNKPMAYLSLFMQALNTSIEATKVGFSLKIDDIPNTNRNKEKIQEWESQWWTKRISNSLYKANIDTTFALYRPKYHTKSGRFLQGIRTAPPFVAKHESWYIDNDNLTEEQNYFMQHCNSSSSWRINEDGTLSDKRYD